MCKHEDQNNKNIIISIKESYVKHLLKKNKNLKKSSTEQDFDVMKWKRICHVGKQQIGLQSTIEEVENERRNTQDLSEGSRCEII